MVIFNSYISHYQRVNPCKSHENPIKPSFSYGFPMVFLWFYPIIRRRSSIPDGGHQVAASRGFPAPSPATARTRRDPVFRNETEKKG